MREAFNDQVKRDKAIITKCETCSKQMTWNQIGDVPKFCDDCYRRHKGMERIHNPIWMKTKPPLDGSFLERIDAIVHFSAQANKWYIKESERWVGANPTEIARVFSWLYWYGKKEPSVNQRQYQCTIHQTAIEEYKNYCIKRCETNDSRKTNNSR